MTTSTITGWIASAEIRQHVRNFLRPRWVRVVLGCVAFLFAAFVFLVFCFAALNEYIVTRNIAAWHQRAERGNVESQQVLGHWYLHGEYIGVFSGVPHDNKKAVYWLGRASRSGYRPAYFDYAQALERTGNTTLAFQWYNKAFAHPLLSTSGSIAVNPGAEAAERLYFVYKNGELGQAKNSARAAAYRKYVPWEPGDMNKGGVF